MIMPEQMQDAVDDQKLHFRFERMPCRVCLGLGTRNGDQDIADIVRACLRVRFRGGEGKHVGRGVHSQIIQI